MSGQGSSYGLRPVMACLGLAGLVLASLPSALRSEAALPSGLQAALLEGFVELQPDGIRWARFRYVMPELATGAGYDNVQMDFVVLCDTAALPMLRAAGEDVAQVVVSLMDRPVEFGAVDPQAIQFFEMFSVQDGRCIWEEF